MSTGLTRLLMRSTSGDTLTHKRKGSNLMWRTLTRVPQRL